jgi:hypothetical protein
MCTPMSLSLYLASIISQRSLLKIPVLKSLLLLVRETSFIFKMFITKRWCCTSVLDTRPKFYSRNRRFKTYAYGYGGQSLRPFLQPKDLFVVPSFPADSTLSGGPVFKSGDSKIIVWWTQTINRHRQTYHHFCLYAPRINGVNCSIF